MSAYPPSERITITYTSHSDGGEQPIELPLRLLILGNFQGNTADAAVPLAQREAADITNENFAHVMQAQKVGLRIEVENQLNPEANAPPLALHLRFDGLKDFHPDQLVKQIPQLNRLRTLRALLTKLRIEPEKTNHTLAALEDLLADWRAKRVDW